MKFSEKIAGIEEQHLETVVQPRKPRDTTNILRILLLIGIVLITIIFAVLISFVEPKDPGVVENSAGTVPVSGDAVWDNYTIPKTTIYYTVNVSIGGGHGGGSGWIAPGNITSYTVIVGGGGAGGVAHISGGLGGKEYELFGKTGSNGSAAQGIGGT